MRQTVRTLSLGALLAATLSATPALAQHSHDGDDSPAPWSQADAYYDPAEMAEARAQVQHHAGGQNFWFVMADRFEIQSLDGEETGVWDAQGWYGGDINKLFVKTEGEYSFEGDEVEDAEIQALWSRAISPYWDLQTGLRYDVEPDGKAHGVFGVQGLAPYLFEVDAAAFVSEDGDVTARTEVEYELLLTQRLILQPRLEANFSFQDVPDRELGTGLTNLDAGVRLRYEIKREFAPYVGVEWQGAFGETADIIEAAGGDAQGTAFVAGIRAWF
ncbi:copper resistance protein B [Parvularcula flava]|uniref:Copper resistance protein B n=1 Tax=Aquisalinus luteolus TaxID=1566827 RepID=A0A8J3A6B2_9PROT|nr:copper resistance protein B [Aquisalinus luteolus]NHK29687.1 copper resistance protein B [Aquisalinus luteolus]GGI02106.1 copper resistance protein B [Aquisalinus luteolus]